MSIATKFENDSSVAILEEPIGSKGKALTQGAQKELTMKSPHNPPPSLNREKVLSTLILAILAAYDEGITHNEVRAICGAAWGDWQEKIGVRKINFPGNYN